MTPFTIGQKITFRLAEKLFFGCLIDYKKGQKRQYRVEYRPYGDNITTIFYNPLREVWIRRSDIITSPKKGKKNEDRNQKDN